ncbi:hypothetical protein CFIO01_03194 [Colletotrichum fioriniae PJ7]|uniref:Uncharacterized protein n=1 Tax=Colletotrichum fioriniae PJ7 TaxID=1445577 RepID=A0A010R0G1_9PEZI|nr:hypothetical protein CFIO01_03194 [Colletotrichum fioriniae PJ7]
MQNNEFRDRVETVEDLNPATLKIIWIRVEQETSGPGGITIGHKRGSLSKSNGQATRPGVFGMTSPRIRRRPPHTAGGGRCAIQEAFHLEHTRT